MSAGAWAMLFAEPDARWRVIAGSVRGISFFFEDASHKEQIRMADPSRCRFVWCPEGVRLGVVVELVTIKNGHTRVVWPPEGK